MIENTYLLYSHYGIKETDTTADIIMKAAEKSYREFCRNISFQSSVPADNRAALEREVENLLSAKIAELPDTATTQDSFDTAHNNICNDIIRVFEAVGGISYGIAQRWLNLTLLNLVVIESVLASDILSLNAIRQYFHAPVDKYVIEAAASNRILRPFQHGLKLQAAPIQLEDDTYSVEWFTAGKSVPYEFWDYDMYINFQTAIRERLTADITNGTYQDVLDWSMNAYLEVIARRIG